MGRGMKRFLNKLKKLNMTRLRKQLRKILVNILPKPFKKPVRLLFAILGLFAYLKFMIWLSQSEYLILAKQWIDNGVAFVILKFNIYVLLFFIVALGYLLIRSYIVEPLTSSSPGNQKPSNKKSYYHEINAVIGLMYVAITIGAILPHVLS